MLEEFKQASMHKVKCQHRLQGRKLRIWQQDYLHYYYLWDNLQWAITTSRNASIDLLPFVLDVGCGNKPYIDMFNNSFYIGIDIASIDALPDIIGSAMHLPIKSNLIGIILSTQVIEHIPDPVSMIMECYRVLKPGGFLILSGPFYWPLHEEPHDFYRFTKYGFETLVKKAGFTHYEIRPDGGDWTQIFLSINLRLVRRWQIPLRIIMNIFGLFFNYLFKHDKSPPNYTVLARK